MKLYLAGPMRGHKRFNFDRFFDLAVKLRKLGHEVISPAEMDVAVGFDPERDEATKEFMVEAWSRDRDAILASDAVAFMSGYEKSEGCQREMFEALAYNRELYYIIEHEDGSVELDRIRVASIIFRDSEAPDEEDEEEEDILDEAKRITSGDRNASYGDPNQDFQRTADFWTTYLGDQINEPIVKHQVAMMMTLLKISRSVWDPFKRDNWVDGPGYFRCGWRCVKAEKQEEDDREKEYHAYVDRLFEPLVTAARKRGQEQGDCCGHGSNGKSQKEAVRS